MSFKTTQKEMDTNYVKQEIINWTSSQNVEIQIEILLGDYRDGPNLSNKVGVIVFFKTNREFELYKENGFVSKLKLEIISLLKNTILKQEEQIVFIFDALSNRNLYFFKK